MKHVLIAGASLAAFAFAPPALAQVPGGALPEAPPEQIEPAQPLPQETPDSVTPDTSAAQAPRQTADAAEAQVFFESGSTRIATVHETEIAAAAEGWSGGQVIVTGFSDQSGDADANLALSERRSEAVKQLLVKHGVDADMIQVKAMGETAANGETSEDRRVDIAFLSSAEQSDTP